MHGIRLPIFWSHFVQFMSLPFTRVICDITMEFNSLPKEVSIVILEWADLQSLGRLSQSRKRLRRIVSHEGWITFYNKSNYDIRHWPISRPMEITSIIDQLRFCVEADYNYYRSKFTLSNFDTLQSCSKIISLCEDIGEMRTSCLPYL